MLDGVLLGKTHEGTFVDTGKRLRQTREGRFRRNRHRRKDVLLKQARERTHDGEFFTNDMHLLVYLIFHS